MGALVVPSIFKAIDKITAPVRRMEKSVSSFAKKSEGAINRADRAFRKVTPGIGEMQKQFLGLAGTAAIVTAIGAGFVSSAKDIGLYEETLASVQAITGVNDKVFEGFKTQIISVATQTKKSSIEVAKAFEIVGSAKPELLKNAEALGAVTQASIVLSKASKEDLESSAKSLTGTLNQFNLGAEHSERVINALAAGSQKGSAAIPLISESLDKFGAVAASMNVSVEDSVGLIETLAEKNIKGAEAGTKLRNVLTKMATAKALPKEALSQLSRLGVNTDIVSDSSLSLEKRLKELSKIQNDATALSKVFGTENLVAGQVLLQNVDKVKSYTDAVTGTNVANEQAAINSNTVNNRLTELSAAWTTLITKNTASNGSLGIFKNLLVFVADNLGTIVTVIGSVVAAYAAFFLILKVSRAMLFAYNTVLGITTVIQKRNLFALRANTVAIKSAAITTKVITAVQWLWNAATMAGAVAMQILLSPITLIILAVVALIAVVTIIIKKWNDWGAALSLLLGPLGFVISLVQSFRRNWDMIKQAFQTGGIIGGLKAIGATILDAVLMPLQQLLELISKVPGVGDLAASGAGAIEELRTKIGVNTETDESGAPLINAEAAAETARLERSESVEKQEVTFNVNDPNGILSPAQNDNGVPVNVGSTSGF